MEPQLRWCKRIYLLNARILKVLYINHTKGTFPSANEPIRKKQGGRISWKRKHFGKYAKKIWLKGWEIRGEMTQSRLFSAVVCSCRKCWELQLFASITPLSVSQAATHRHLRRAEFLENGFTEYIMIAEIVTDEE